MNSNVKCQMWKIVASRQKSEKRRCALDIPVYIFFEITFVYKHIPHDPLQ